jgi:hypothetical protein
LVEIRGIRVRTFAFFRLRGATKRRFGVTGMAGEIPKHRTIGESSAAPPGLEMVFGDPTHG